MDEISARLPKVARQQKKPTPAELALTYPPGRGPGAAPKDGPARSHMNRPHARGVSDRGSEEWARGRG